MGGLLLRLRLCRAPLRSRLTARCLCCVYRLYGQAAYAHLAGDSFGDGGEEGSGKRNPGAAALGMGSDADFHPYVFLPLSLPAGTTK